MAQIDDDADALLGYVERNESFRRVGQNLKELGSLQQATKEAKAALEKARVDYTEAQRALSEINNKIGAINKQIADDRAAADLAIQSSRQKANEMADTIISDATRQATQLVIEANASIAAAKEASNAALAAKQAEVTKAETRLNELNAAAAAAEARRASIEAGIQEMKAAARAVAA